MVNLKKVREAILNSNQNIDRHDLHYVETPSRQKLSYCAPANFWFDKSITIICDNDNNVSFVCEKYESDTGLIECALGNGDVEDFLTAKSEAQLANYIKNNKKIRSTIVDKEPGRVKTFLVLDDQDKHKELMVALEWDRLVFACKHYWPDLVRSEIAS